MHESSLNMSQIDIVRLLSQVTFGQVVYPPGGQFGPRTQDVVQIFLVDTAHATVYVEQTKYRVHAGEALLLMPGRRQVFSFAEDEPTQHSWIAYRFDPHQSEWMQTLEDGPKQLKSTRRMQAIVELGLSDKISEMRLAHAKSGWLMTLAVAFLQLWRDASDHDQAAPPLPEPLRRAQHYIHRNSEHAMTLTDIARAAHVTEHHLSRLFRKHLDESPMQYLWRLRVERGIDMLRQTGLNVSEIAYRVGFTSPYHFSRRIRQHTGHPPRELRQ